MPWRASSGLARIRALSFAAAAGLLLGAAAQAKAPDRALVPVFYPKGGCESGWLEVQVYDRAAERWKPHPGHPRVRAGSCFQEPSDILLTDLRVRCIDPRGRRSPSTWVQGTDLRGTSGGKACKPADADGKAVKEGVRRR